MKTKDTKSLLNRSFSLLLAFVLVFGMLPTPSFALPAGVSITDTGSDAQTLYPASLSNGQIWTDKSVRYLGTNDPNFLLNGQFEITLRAAGQDYKAAQPPVKFDIILALDYSLSMNEEDDNGVSKLSKQTTAAKAIVLQLVGPENNKTGNRVSIVKFRDMAVQKQDFTDSFSVLDNKIGESFTDGTGYTNIQNAFLVSQNAFNARPNKTRKPILILVSDGAPTVFHNSLTSHTTSNDTRDANSGADYVWWTIEQGKQLKLGADTNSATDDVPIYTIGFDLTGNAIAEATLQPTESNTASYRPGSYTAEKRNITATAWYRVLGNSGSSDDTLFTPIETRDGETLAYGSWTPYSSQIQPVNVTDNISLSGSVQSTGSGSNRKYYRQGNRADVEYRNVVFTQVAFSHDYWEDGFIIGNNYDDLYDALNAISQSFINSKPLDHIVNNGYTDLVIEDVIGSDFEVVGTLPTGVTKSGNTVTWTIDGDAFVTQAPNTAAFEPSKVTEVRFIVKVKDDAALNTLLYTNASAKGMFTVPVSNPFYPDNALNQQQPLTNKGWLKLIAPPVAATITVTKQVTGPVTSTGRTFSFTLYDAASNGNIVAGPINITVNGANSNTGTFSFNIPYNGFNGNNQATYYVQENNTGIPVHWTYDITARKAVTVTRSTPTGSATFTNSYAPTGTLIVKKAWTGNGPQSNVSFNLYKRVGDAWVTVSTGHTILAGNTNGVTIGDLALDTQYKVVETGIQDYLTAYSVEYVEFTSSGLIAGQESLEKTITITNDYQTPIGKIKLTKVWDDNNNVAGDRPSEIKFNIQGPAGYTGQSDIILTAAGGWTNTLSTLTFGEYTFTEVTPLDYEPDANPKSQTISIEPIGSREASLTFTNKYIIPKGTLTVKKIWKDEAPNFQAFRPATITLKLLKDGVLTGDEVILPETDATPWEHTFTGLEFGVYSVEELSVPDYTVSYSPDVTLTKLDPAGGKSLRTGQINVTNTFNNPKGELTVSKKWVEGGLDVAAVRPVSIDVTLLKNGNPLSTQTLNDANSWSYKFTGLDLDDAIYTVTESSIDAASLSMYEAQIIYSGTGALEDHIVIGPSARSGSVAITNTYAKGTITVAKVWKDKFNPLDELPQSAVVTLHKVTIIPPVIPVPDPSAEAGAPPIVDMPAPTIQDVVVGTQTITRPANTPVVFYDLEIADNVSYYVVEGDIPYYTPSFDKSSVKLTEEQPNETVTVTNTYDDPKGSLSVTKEWDHGNNPTPPTEITVELYADGIYLTEKTFSGEYTFENLELDKVYTIKEVGVENYSTDYNDFVSYTPVKETNVEAVYTGSVNIENTYIPELGDLTVNKEWVDKTGAAIDITVSRAYGETPDTGFILTEELNSENEWSHTFEGLEVYGPGGIKYTYSVQEDGLDLVLYTQDISDTAVLFTDENSDITIVNTYAPEKGQLVITKEWLGLEEESIDPPVTSVEVRLVVNGVPEESTMILDTQNDWTVYRSELNVENTYSVIEVTRFEEFDVSYSAENIQFNIEGLKRNIKIFNTRTVDEPSIDVNKSLSNALVQLSGGTATFNYSVQLINNGNRTLNALSVLDKMTGPTGATFTYNPAPVSTSSNGALFELGGVLKPGESTVFNYSVTVNLAGTYTNVATGYGYYVETEVSDTGEATGVVTNPPTPNPDPDPVPTQGLVNVTFVDTDGVTLSPGYQMVGTVGTNYSTTAREIVGYALVETPVNANGIFIDGSLSVIYIYDVVTEVVTEEETPLGEAVTEPPTEAVLIPEEDTPLADALPKTGQLPAELFITIGGLVSAAGVFLKKRR